MASSSGQSESPSARDVEETGVEIYKRLLEAPHSEWMMLRTRRTAGRAGVLYKCWAGCSVTADVQELKMTMTRDHDAFNWNVVYEVPRGSQNSVLHKTHDTLHAVGVARQVTCSRSCENNSQRPKRGQSVDCQEFKDWPSDLGRVILTRSQVSCYSRGCVQLTQFIV